MEYNPDNPEFITQLKSKIKDMSNSELAEIINSIGKQYTEVARNLAKDELNFRQGSVQATTPINTEEKSTPISNLDQNNSLADFLSFNQMITPITIRVIYALGAFAISVYSGILFYLGITQKYILPTISDRVGYKLFTVGLSIIIFTFGNLLWRLACEFHLLFFRMHDVIASIEKKLDK